MEISPYFRDLFLRTIVVFPLDYFLYVTYVIIMIIIIIIIVIIIIIIVIIIIALLCDKLAKSFFPSQLPMANLLCSQILMNAIVMFVMLMLTVPTQMVHIIASAKKDTL